MSDDLPVPSLPVPDFDDGPSGAASDGTHQVTVGPIVDPVAVAGALAQILSVDLATASRLASTAPCVVAERVSWTEANRIVAELEALRLQAQSSHVAEEPLQLGSPVRFSSAPPAGPASLPPPPSAPGPRYPSAPPRPASSPSPDWLPGHAVGDLPSDGPAPSFWTQAPVAFVAPFLGHGLYLLLAAGLSGLAVAAAAFMPGLFLINCLRLPIVLGLQLTSIGLFVEVFERLAQAAMARDLDSTLPSPHSGWPNARVLFYRGIANSLVFGLLGLLVVALMLKYDEPAVIVVGGAIGFCYWPMALTVQSITGRITAPFDVITVCRSMIAAPLEYLAVCLLLALTVGGGSLLFVEFAGVVDQTSAQTRDIGKIVGLTGAFIFLYYLALAYFHGVVGYLMGALIRAKADRYGFLQV